MSGVIADVSFPLQADGGTTVVRDRLSLRLLSLNGCTIDAGWNNLDMTAPHWRLYCNLDDGAEARVRGRLTSLHAGHVYVIPAWLGWQSRCRGRVRHGNALFDLPALPRERVINCCPDIMRLAIPTERLAQSWLSLLGDLARAERAGPDLVARGHALTWDSLAAMFTALGPMAATLQPPTCDERMEHLRQWIEPRLDRPLSRAVLARAAGCSEAELARRFAADLGTAPARWLRQRRATLGAELLRSSDLPLEAIAQRCGFGDRCHFSKVFATLFGRGPAEYRRWSRRE